MSDDPYAGLGTVVGAPASDPYAGIGTPTSAPQETGLAADFGRGVRGVATGLAGLADFASEAVNAPINVGLELTGHKPLPSGSARQAVAHAADAAHLATPTTGPQKFANTMIEGATQGLIPIGDGLTIGQMIRSAVVGGTAAAGAQTAEDAAPDNLKPVAGLAAGLGAGLLTHEAMVRAPQAMGAIARAARPVVASVAAPDAALSADVGVPTSGATAAGAADILRDRATNPTSVSEMLRQGPDVIVPGSEPTTFQQTGDLGLGSLEREQAVKRPDLFKAREAEQQAARTEVLQNIQRGADPNALADTLRTNLDEIDAHTQANVEAAAKTATDRATALAGTGTPEATGASVRDAITTAEDAARQQERALWKAVDPNNDLMGNVVGTRQAANDIVEGMPKTAKPLAGEEAGIFKSAQEMQPLTPVSDLIALRSRTSDAMRNELIQNGRTASYARLVQLRGAIQDNLSQTIAHQVAAEDAAAASGQLAEGQTVGDRIQAWVDEYRNNRAAAAGTGGGAGPAEAALGPAASGAPADGTGLPAARGPGGAAGDQGLSEWGILSSPKLREIADLTTQARALRNQRLAATNDAEWEAAHKRLLPVAEKLNATAGHPLGLDDEETAARFGLSKKGARSPLSEEPDQALIAAARKEFGVTSHPEAAGFVLPNGRMLDFSEEGGDGSRTQDHRAVNVLPGISGSGSDGLIDFMSKTGAVRVDFNSGLFDTARIPTSEQVRAAVKAARSLDKPLILEYSPDGGAPIGHATLDRPTVGAVEKFFADMPQPEKGQRAEPVTAPSAGAADAAGAPTFDADAAARLAAATEVTKARARTFGMEPISPTLAKAGAADLYRLPEARVPEKFFHPGPASFQHMQSLYAAIGKEQGVNLMSEYAAMSARRAAMDADGTLNPAKLQRWAAQHDDALRALPPQVRAQFMDAAQATKAISVAQTARAAALKEVQSGAIGRVLNTSEPEDVTRTIGNILNSRTAVADMGRIANAAKRDPMAVAGLRQAVADYMLSRTISNAEAGALGVNALKGDTFATFFKRARPALAKVFTGPEIDNMEAVVNDVQRARRSIDATKLSGGSNTAQDTAKRPSLGTGGLIGNSILFTITDQIASAATHNQPIALAAGLGAAVTGAMRDAGLRRIDELITQAMLHPNVAEALLRRFPAEPNGRSALHLASTLRRSAAASTMATLAVPQAKKQRP